MFFDEENNNLKIPENYKTEDGVNLGTWLGTQKSSYKGFNNAPLTYEKIKMLEDLNIKWFSDNIDKKLQKEKIKEFNKRNKEIEILNRFKSFLLSYDSTTLPSKEELNKKFIKKLG